MKDNPKWSYTKTIEEMGEHELFERIKNAMNYEIKNKIKTMPYLGGEELMIEYFYSELQARCPMTGLKDLYKIKIKFVPNKTIPELKSLKFYFFGYEDLPISHEHIIAKVYKDLKNAILPQKMAIILHVATRGEIVTTIALGDKKLLEFSRVKE